MSLISLRADFLRISGRTDLDVPAQDRYINRGQRFLDRRTQFKHGRSMYLEVIQQGDNQITFSSQCRVIQSVYTLHTVDGRAKVHKKGEKDYLEDTASAPTGIDQGRPGSYTQTMIRTDPEISTVAGINPYLGYYPGLVGVDETFNGISFSPPADQEYLMEVRGRFYTDALAFEFPATDADSWWSLFNYSILLHASLYELEVDYRNTQGADDWLARVTIGLKDLTMDDASEDAQDIGSWETE